MTGAVERLEFLWVGWPGASVAPEDEEAVRAYALKQFQAEPVFVAQERMDRFYHGFCNRTLWPLFHYFQTLTHYLNSHTAVRRLLRAMAGDLAPGQGHVANSPSKPSGETKKNGGVACELSRRL